MFGSAVGRCIAGGGVAVEAGNTVIVGVYEVDVVAGDEDRAFDEDRPVTVAIGAVDVDHDRHATRVVGVAWPGNT